jgi:flagellar motility protein MotE (MotC chaperone)
VANESRRKEGIVMIDPGLLISLGSFVIAVVLAYLNVRKAVKDKELARRADLEKEYKAPAERDSIIVSATQEAVTVLKLTLRDTRAENNKLRARIDEQDRVIAEQEKRIRALETEIARMSNERGGPR